MTDQPDIDKHSHSAAITLPFCPRCTVERFQVVGMCRDHQNPDDSVKVVAFRCPKCRKTKVVCFFPAADDKTIGKRVRATYENVETLDDVEDAVRATLRSAGHPEVNFERQGDNWSLSGGGIIIVN